MAGAWIWVLLLLEVALCPWSLEPLQVLTVRAHTQAAVCKISTKVKIKAVLGHPLSCLVEFRLLVAAQVARFRVLVGVSIRILVRFWLQSRPQSSWG